LQKKKVFPTLPYYRAIYTCQSFQVSIRLEFVSPESWTDEKSSKFLLGKSPTGTSGRLRQLNTLHD